MSEFIEKLKGVKYGILFIKLRLNYDLIESVEVCVVILDEDNCGFDIGLLEYGV